MVIPIHFGESDGRRNQIESVQVARFRNPAMMKRKEKESSILRLEGT